MIIEDLAGLATPIDKLELLPGNPRRGDVDAIARSLNQFGQRKPIVARRDGTVIAGNHTLQAARQLDWSDVAVVWVDDDDVTAAAFALADNRTNDFGTYDEQLLAAMIGQVLDDEELLAATSYTLGDHDALLALLNGPSYLDGKTDDDIIAAAHQALWPVISIQVEPVVFQRWCAVPGDDDRVRLTTVLDTWEQQC